MLRVPIRKDKENRNFESKKNWGNQVCRSILQNFKERQQTEILIFLKHWNFKTFSAQNLGMFLFFYFQGSILLIIAKKKKPT